MASYEAKRTELLEKFEKQAAEDEAARLALSRDLEDARTIRAELEQELATLQLAPIDTEIRVERILVPGDCDVGQPQVVLANPFTDDFVRLWNNSAAGGQPADAR